MVKRQETDLRSIDVQTINGKKKTFNFFVQSIVEQDKCCRMGVQTETEPRETMSWHLDFYGFFSSICCQKNISINAVRLKLLQTAPSVNITMMKKKGEQAEVWDLFISPAARLQKKFIKSPFSESNLLQKAKRWLGSQNKLDGAEPKAADY